MEKIKIFTLSIILVSFISCNKEFKPEMTKITPEIYFNVKSKIYKKTIIHFWWSFCDPCIRDYPELEKIIKKKQFQFDKYKFRQE